MDMTSLKTKAIALLKKYRYVVIVLAIGLVLMALPTGSDKQQTDTEATVTQSEETEFVSDQLANILSKIDGAGNVQVLLTVAAGEETLYQTDNTVTVNGESSTTQVETIIITSADKAQSGLVRQVNPPTYLGAIVVCQGADCPTVQLAIVDAVSKVTGLGANRISVLKMK